MTINTKIPELERIVYFRGQQLTAADLTAVQESQKQLRWLHNRSLHNWGIAAGLGVTGERGDSIVVVQPGFAVDCMGREIIVAEEQQLTVPAVAGGVRGEATFYITAAYVSDADQPLAEERHGVCLPSGAVRIGNEARIEWKTPDQVRDGRDLILAQAWILNCKLSRRISLAPRRSARPDLQQYVFSGQTAVGSTRWSLWQPDNTITGIATEVDTSAARFQTTPAYQAHIIGERLQTVGGTRLLLTDLPVIAEPTPSSFTIQAILLFRILSSDGAVTPEEAEAQLINDLDSLEWTITWMGIEA